MEAINARIEWLELRARMARMKANALLADELEETAAMLKWIQLAMKNTIESGKTGYLIEALSAVDENNL